MRILIAEDEVTIARVLKVMLEKNKYAVDMVHNGSDALDYIQAVGYDALVLDIMMPGKDGIEVLKADRAEGNTTPALFLTAKAEVADRVVGLDAGADDYLPKPFAANEFLARVRALTRRSNTYASFALSFGNVTLDCCQYLLKTAFEEVWLNNKEFQLTELFLRHPRQVFSSEHLMDKKKQFDILKKLMNAPDVTEVVNACDAGREGEMIFRSVYELAGCKKPMKRLWISSMEDSAIREGFANLRPGADYDGLRDAALCRAKADWLVGINATRLFSVLYHRTLNIGRVMSPTLALIVQREAEIDAFQPVPFYTVALELPGLTVSGERMADKVAAEQLKEACQGANVTIKKVECKEKSEKPPALYDLTTLQRDANRLLGFTAQQTLDYLQSLYEKKLCTYPRTDSRYLTGDMADSLPVLVNLVANAMPFRKGIAITCDPQTVINDKKVTDHHAVIPTRNLKDADLSALPAGEKAVLELVALRLMCAVAQPHIYSETVVIAACAGGEFTTKGKTVKHPGWKALEDTYRAKMKDAEPKKEGAEKALPELTEGQTLSVAAAIVKEGKSSPPQHFTEDTLLSAMETAGKEDMPEDAERKGLGTPATRAGILEKLVSAGFLERKKSRKTVQLLPSHDAVSLITVLPEQLQSPLLTAEWEYRLGEIERGQLAPEEFLDGISTMLKDLVGTYQVIKGTEYLFTPPREVVGKCPRCGGEVAELQKGFFCQNDSCKFAIWKNNKCHE